MPRPIPEYPPRPRPTRGPCEAGALTAPVDAALEAQLRAGEPRAAVAALQTKGAGPTLATLAALAGDPDQDTRLNAIEALAQLATAPAAADDAVRAAIQGLAFRLAWIDDDQPAATAINILRVTHPVGCGPQLHALFTQAPVDYVRELAPILAGFDGASADRSPWLAAREPRLEPYVKIGLARMGDAAARAWFATWLAADVEDSSGIDADARFRHAIYMDEPWILSALAPLLDDQRVAFTTSSHRSPRSIRYADLAAYAISMLLRDPAAPGPVAPRQYLAIERDEVRTLVAPHVR